MMNNKYSNREAEKTLQIIRWKNKRKAHLSMPDIRWKNKHGVHLSMQLATDKHVLVYMNPTNYLT